jgi:hypothetical protein
MVTVTVTNFSSKESIAQVCNTKPGIPVTVNIKHKKKREDLPDEESEKHGNEYIVTINGNKRRIVILD